VGEPCIHLVRPTHLLGLQVLQANTSWAASAGSFKDSFCLPGWHPRSEGAAARENQVYGT
jgi:hypothetical protein